MSEFVDNCVKAVKAGDLIPIDLGKPSLWRTQQLPLFVRNAPKGENVESRVTE